jgi:L-arabinonolactonase
MKQSTQQDVMEQAHFHLASLGEGLTWHAEQGRWWWTDIDAAMLHTWSPADDVTSSFTLPDRAGSYAHTRSGRMLLGLAKRLCLVDASNANSTDKLPARMLAAVDPAESRTRVNDGRTDRNGYFVFGTMNEAAEQRPIASFYQYSLQYGLRRLALPAVAIANSICFSLDGKTMYFTDTLTRNIMQCDYDSPSSRVANIRLFVAFGDADGMPDGSVIDAEGCLWNAQWGGGRVVRYAPDGTVLRRIDVPAKNPTCPAFGGPGMNQLMVTTARKDTSREELAAMPGAGALFTCEIDDVIGVPDALFDDESVNDSFSRTA